MINEESVVFKRLVIHPDNSLPKQILKQDGRIITEFTLTKEKNGYAMWKTVITDHHKHDEFPELDTTLVEFFYNGETKYDLIEKTVDIARDEEKRLKENS